MLSVTTSLLTFVIIILGIVLSLAGVFIDGVYAGNSVSLIAQAKGQDLVTLVIAVPALLIALIFALRGSIRGALAVAGLLGYFLYTYASYAFMVQFNKWFLGYVALFSCSLFAFILLVTSLLKAIPTMISVPPAPLRVSAVLFLIVAMAILVMWLSQIIPAMFGKSARIIEDSGDKPVIQVLDLGVIVPAAIVIAVLVFRGAPTGPVWATILLVKGLTLALAIVSMTIFMARAGTPDIGGAVIFSVFSLLFVGAFIWLFSAMRVVSGTT